MQTLAVISFAISLGILTGLLLTMKSTLTHAKILRDLFQFRLFTLGNISEGLPSSITYSVVSKRLIPLIGMLRYSDIQFELSPWCHLYLQFVFMGLLWCFNVLLTNEEFSMTSAIVSVAIATPLSLIITYLLSSAYFRAFNKDPNQQADNKNHPQIQHDNSTFVENAGNGKKKVSGKLLEVVCGIVGVGVGLGCMQCAYYANLESEGVIGAILGFVIGIIVDVGIRLILCAPIACLKLFPNYTIKYTPLITNLTPKDLKLYKRTPKCNENPPLSSVMENSSSVFNSLHVPLYVSPEDNSEVCSPKLESYPPSPDFQISISRMNIPDETEPDIEDFHHSESGEGFADDYVSAPRVDILKIWSPERHSIGATPYKLPARLPELKRHSMDCEGLSPSPEKIQNYNFSSDDSPVPAFETLDETASHNSDSGEEQYIHPNHHFQQSSIPQNLIEPENSPQKGNIFEIENCDFNQDLDENSMVSPKYNEIWEMDSFVSPDQPEMQEVYIVPSLFTEDYSEFQTDGRSSISYGTHSHKTSLAGSQPRIITMNTSKSRSQSYYDPSLLEPSITRLDTLKIASKPLVPPLLISYQAHTEISEPVTSLHTDPQEAESNIIAILSVDEPIESHSLQENSSFVNIQKPPTGKRKKRRSTRQQPIRTAKVLKQETINLYGPDVDIEELMGTIRSRSSSVRRKTVQDVPHEDTRKHHSHSPRRDENTLLKASTQIESSTLNISRKHLRNKNELLDLIRQSEEGNPITIDQKIFNRKKSYRALIKDVEELLAVSRQGQVDPEIEKLSKVLAARSSFKKKFGRPKLPYALKKPEDEPIQIGDKLKRENGSRRRKTPDRLPPTVLMERNQ